MISSTLKIKKSCINQRCLWEEVKNETSKQQKRYCKNRLPTIFNYQSKKKKDNTNNNTKEHSKIGDILLHSGTLLRILVLLVVFCSSMQQLDCVEFSKTTIANIGIPTINVYNNNATINNSAKNDIAHHYKDATTTQQAAGTIKRKYRRKLINSPTNQENIRYSIYKGKRRKHLKHPINRKYSNTPSSPVAVAITSTSTTTPTPTPTTSALTTWKSKLYMQQQQQQQQLHLSTEHSKNTMPKSTMLQQQQHQQQHQILQSQQQKFIQHQQQHDITHVTNARKYLHVYELQQQQEQKFMSPTRMNNATTVKGVHWQKQHEFIYQQLPRNLTYIQQQHHRNKQQQHQHNDHTSSLNKSSNRKDHVIAEGKTDIILYRNVVGPLPCPPGLLPHRIIPVYSQKQPTNQQHQGKL